MLRKGFAKKEGGNHTKLVFYHKGKKTSIYTLYSRSCSEIDDYLIAKMSKQIRLSKKDFIAFVSCTLSQKAYLNKIKSIIE